MPAAAARRATSPEAAQETAHPQRGGQEAHPRLAQMQLVEGERHDEDVQHPPCRCLKPEQGHDDARGDGVLSSRTPLSRFSGSHPERTRSGRRCTSAMINAPASSITPASTTTAVAPPVFVPHRASTQRRSPDR